MKFFYRAGSEALFADVGHFTVRSIQISMCTVIYPSIILAYTRQASYLRKHNDVALDAFYTSIPGEDYIKVVFDSPNYMEMGGTHFPPKI